MNGRIKLNTLTAQNAKLQTTNGSINGQLSASQATISTTNGSIDLILGRVTGRYELSTFNGSIELDVPDDPLGGLRDLSPEHNRPREGPDPQFYLPAARAPPRRGHDEQLRERPHDHHHQGEHGERRIEIR
jgi:hypothetical protein